MGNWVWLHLRHRPIASLQAPTKGKLKPRYYGSYCITELINPVAVCLDLPPRARLHYVFHVGLLKPFVGVPPAAPPPLPALHHGAAILEPVIVVRTRLAHGIRQVLVQWKNEPASSGTWEDVDSF